MVLCNVLWSVSLNNEWTWWQGRHTFTAGSSAIQIQNANY